MTDSSVPANPSIQSRARPPRARREPQRQSLHGVERVDEYAWLKDENWQQVMKDPSLLRQDIREYLEAENQYAQSVLDGLQGLQQTLFDEFKGRIKEDDSSVPEPDGPWAYYQRYRTGGEHPVMCRRPSDRLDEDASTSIEQVLLDGDRMAEGHAYFRFGACEHSPDHRLMGYSLDLNGSEIYTIRFKDVESGDLLEDRIEGTAGGFEWSNDGRAVYYVTLDDKHRPVAVWRHRMGTPQSADEKVYDEPDAGFFVGISKTSSRRFILIDAHDHVTSEVWLIDADGIEATPRVVVPRESHHEYHVAHHGEHLFILTNADGAEDFKLVRAPLDTCDKDNWVDWVAHRPGTLIVDFAVFGAHVARLERVDALPRIVVHALDDDRSHEIAFEEE
ncbi:MAG: S9 family peptidase, partial [Gammaproteobacteria bacterium]|nr:S9 family peptidase [Gammaproteobacteria bacterium]